MLFSGDFITFLAGKEMISYTSYFLFMLSTRGKESALNCFLIVSILSSMALFLSALIFYSHSGSFLFSHNELLFRDFDPSIQILLLCLLGFAFLARPLWFLLSPRAIGMGLFENRSLPISFFLLIILTKIPFYGLFFFVFGDSCAVCESMQNFPYFLSLFGGLILFVGYFRIYKDPISPLLFPLLAFSEGGYLIISLSLLSESLLASFILLLTSQCLSLTLLYVLWFYTPFKNRSTLPRSLFTLIALFALVGFPPFLSFGSKVALIESLLELQFPFIAFTVACGYLISLWILIKNLHFF